MSNVRCQNRKGWPTQIDLKQMPSESEIKLVQREIKLHSDLQHPHIIRLWDTLLDGDRIYMIMEYADGGNLFTHQNSKTCFSEAQAFKYFIQTLEGVRYLHRQNIIHRDLKPENLLLDSNLNIKICDFGWCAEDIKIKRTTFCGTYEYMAPQMLFKSSYDYRVDIWAVGILLYEMLHGLAPFKGKNASDVQQAMLRGKYQFSSNLSEQVKQLINSILQFQADKRPSIDEILKHPWVLNMTNHINNYLDAQGAILPKQIQNRFNHIPAPSNQYKTTPKAKHRKNNSLNFQQSRNININLQINNYAFLGKHPRAKNNYHSQQKQHDQFIDFKESFDNYNKTSVKKSKMEPVCKTQISQMDIYKVLQKTKSSKILKSKQGGKSKNEDSKKKIKLRKSEMDITEKMPIRFNTQAFEKDQSIQPRLKKSHLKHKNAPNTKSTLRLQRKD